MGLVIVDKRIPEDRVRRFMNKVRKDASGCWEWVGAWAGENRGVFFCPEIGGRNHSVHRFAFMAFIGPIPDGWHVSRTCEGSDCVNPDHLTVEQKCALLPKGEAHYATKFTDEDILIIRDLYRSGDATTAQLCEYYGVTNPAIDGVLSGKRWRHVDGNDGEDIRKIGPRK